MQRPPLATLLFEPKRGIPLWLGQTGNDYDFLERQVKIVIILYIVLNHGQCIRWIQELSLFRELMGDQSMMAIYTARHLASIYAQWIVQSVSLWNGIKNSLTLRSI